MKKAYCDGIRRRDFLRVGAAGALGVNLPLAQLLAAEPKLKGNATNFIFVFLKGGMSTIDTFDLKPNAPEDVRGPFGSIPTNLPGVRVGEHLKQTAKVMHHFSQVRSFTHRNAGHGPADHYMFTGFHPTSGFNGGLKPNNQHPSMGSVIAHKLGARGAIPPYVCLPNMHNSGSSAYLGPDAVPFTIEADPASPGFKVPDLQPPLAVDASRVADRQSLLQDVDRFQQRAEQRANSGAKEFGVFAQRAMDLMTSPLAKKAFDIHQEKDKLRDAYGRTTLGQSCLMARRLIEAGVRCVTVDHSNWDTHYYNFRVLEEDLLPKFDLAIPTLFNDLHDRGLLEKTMVVVTGEFGRTPKINKDAGRDHWSRCFTVLLGGGGIQGGRVIGKSDKWAMDPAEKPYGPEDLCATVYDRLGIDPRSEMHTPEGRPIMLTNSGRVIKELL